MKRPRDQVREELPARKDALIREGDPGQGAGRASASDALGQSLAGSGCIS